jgi:DNA topoisomerase-1
MNTRKIVLVTEPEDSARAAGLRYVLDTKPGIQRRKSGNGFRYLDASGKPVRDTLTLKRIRSLVIPPAWKDVWICPFPNGHLQATGRDARGRKQNRYHPRWREVRDETKYERMLLFGHALPAIREKVKQDLSLPELPRRKVLATIVRLMETTFIRVGNEEYAKQNKSYGLTTMRNKHVQVQGAEITFRFQGKSGVKHTIDLHDRRLAKIIKRCQDIPGYELFQYVDHQGENHTIDSGDVNEYLQEISGQNFTAKDFRTWAGTVLACLMLRQFEAFDSERQAKKNIVQAIQSVAARLGNTPSVCKKCYVHPAVLETYLSGVMPNKAKQGSEDEVIDASDNIQREELAVIQLLKRRLAAA